MMRVVVPELPQEALLVVLPLWLDSPIGSLFTGRSGLIPKNKMFITMTVVARAWPIRKREAWKWLKIIQETDPAKLQVWL